MKQNQFHFKILFNLLTLSYLKQDSNFENYPFS